MYYQIMFYIFPILQIPPMTNLKVYYLETPSTSTTRSLLPAHRQLPSLREPGKNLGTRKLKLPPKVHIKLTLLNT